MTGWLVGWLAVVVMTMSMSLTMAIMLVVVIVAAFDTTMGFSLHTLTTGVTAISLRVWVGRLAVWLDGWLVALLTWCFALLVAVVVAYSFGGLVPRVIIDTVVCTQKNTQTLHTANRNGKK